MNGMSDKISGKSKQVVGKATNNKELQVKGKSQELKGSAKNKIEKI